VLAVSTIRGASSSSEAGQATGRDEPPKKDATESKTRSPVPATSPVTSRLWPTDSDSSPSKPWETVVRIRIAHEHSTGFSSGTIIHSAANESLILSAARHFKREKTANAGEVPYRINVDLFDGKLGGANPNQVHFVETVSGELVDCDFEREVSLVRIRPNRQLPASKVVPRRWEPHVRMEMLTLGCSEGRDATAWNTVITNPRVRGLAGNADYVAIECRTAPKQGRTGGGLFTTDGYLAGVCNFAEPKDNHGLYATPESIYRLLDRNNLTDDTTEPGFQIPQGLSVEPGVESQLDRILNDWEHRAAAWTCLDVRFTGRARNSTWAEDEPLTGRVVLTSSGRAYVDVVGSDDPSKANKSSYTERIIWTDDEVHLIHPATKEHIIWPIAAEDRGKLPVFLALPFCWHLSSDSLKARYHVELLASKHADTWLLGITPSTAVGKEDFKKAFIELDRSTYLPRHYSLINPDGKSTRDYEVTEARSNQPVPEEVWLIPNLPTWKVRRVDGVTSWISRGLVKSQLVP
jgi:hypothetical protein